jgi:hypothetical protein
MRPWSIIPITLQIAAKNLNLDGAFSTGNNIDPTLWSVIAEDGKVIEINIDDTDGWRVGSRSSLPTLVRFRTDGGNCAL